MKSAAASSTRCGSAGAEVDGDAGVGKAVWDSPPEAVPTTWPTSSASSTVSSTTSSQGWKTSRPTATTTTSTAPTASSVALVRVMGVSSGQQQGVEPASYDGQARQPH